MSFELMKHESSPVSQPGPLVRLTLGLATFNVKFCR
jgi:hypothetical protein